ncbi:MAG: DUF5343 domain-containing protein [Candidatus Reddybacter sp.]
MSLSNQYTIAYGQLGDFFTRIREGQAPSQFTQQLLKDLGFKSTNHRAFIPLLKALGFLSPDGAPTSRYHEYRDYSKSKNVMGQAIREAYSDIFLIKENPTKSDKKAIEGKFKSFHNVSDNVAERMAKTFFSLLELADLNGAAEAAKNTEAPIEEEQGNEMESPAIDVVIPETQPIAATTARKNVKSPSLHYNIQIHLPPTKDIEVYNAIFKSLKEHLIEI